MQELSHVQFLTLLKSRAVEVSAKDGRLQVSAPPGTIDAELHAELIRRKPELLETLRHAAPVARTDVLGPMERGGRIPQTCAQQGMWLIDHFAPGNVAYNIPEAFVVEGPVDMERLQVAIDRLLLRHETLRTSFYEEEGELFQSISDQVMASVGFTDLSVLEEPERDRTLHRLIREQAQQPFDLKRAPLVRFHLFRLTKERNAIFFNIHHIISDRKSLMILEQELVALYQAAELNQTAALPDLTVQYADYAIWAEKRLAAGAMAGQLDYWRAKLAGSPYLELRSSRPYPEQRTAWGGNVLVAIPAAVQSALEGIARQEEATMFIALLAAFAVLLYLRTGQEDFCVGSPFNHRSQIETETIIGLFVNMLVFRCQPGAELSFREFFREVRTTALEAYERSDVPFQELVRVLKPDLRSRRSPLFQVMFAFDADTRPGGSGLVELDIDPGTAKFDLTLHLRQGPDGIAGWFEYCTDLFDAADIEELAAQWLRLLVQVTAEPDRAISEFSLQTRAVVESTSLPEEHSGLWKAGIRRIMPRLASRMLKDKPPYFG